MPTAAETIPGWKVWWPDGGITEVDAIFYHAAPVNDEYRRGTPWISDFQEAAEHYAENHCGFHGEPFESVDVYVRDTLSTVVHVVTVRVDYEPTFTASIWVTPL